MKKIIDETTIWDFINKAEKVLFPIDINPECRLIAEYIPYGEPQNQLGYMRKTVENFIMLKYI